MDKNMYVQVNLCPKLLLLHQLTQNMTTDCSLNYKFKSGENMLCTEIVSNIQNNFCTQHVLHFGLIAGLFRQIGGHSSRFVLFCSF